MKHNIDRAFLMLLVFVIFLMVTLIVGCASAPQSPPPVMPAEAERFHETAVKMASCVGAWSVIIQHHADDPAAVQRGVNTARVLTRGVIYRVGQEEAHRLVEGIVKAFGEASPQDVASWISSNAQLCDHLTASVVIAESAALAKKEPAI